MVYLRKASHYIVAAAVIFFIVFASYNRGLFFDKDFYLMEIVFSLIFLSYLLINFKDSIAIFARPYIWLLVGLSFIYFIQSYFAENQLYAFQHFFRWVFVTELFLLVLFIKDKKWFSNIAWISIIITAAWTSIFGWLAAYGLTDFPDAYLTSRRIASVFQYPNTFGAFLTATFMALLIRGTSSKLLYSLSSIASYLLLITVIFTYSRGTWLVLAIVWLVALFFLSFKQQILYILHTIFLGTAILLTTANLSESITNKSYTEGFITFSIASVTVAVLYILAVYSINKLKIDSNKKFIRWVIPVLTIIVMIFGMYAITNPNYVEKLPDNIEQRVKDINFETFSVKERTLFYQDSTELIKDKPLFGHGGGAWKHLYQSYQSYPYVSAQAHNFYSQMLVEVGIFGLLLFIGFIALILYIIIKNRKMDEEDQLNSLLSYGIMILVLLSHSFIDFNMSYLYILGILMILLALVEYPYKPTFRIESKLKSVKYLSISLLVIMAFLSLVYAGKFLYADKAASNLNDASIAEIEKSLDKAISMNPYELDYRFTKVDFYQDLYNQTSDDTYKDKLLDETLYLMDTEAKSSTQTLKLAQTLAANGYFVDSIDVLEKGIKDAPWRTELYEQYFIYNFRLAEYYQKEGNTKTSKELLEKIIVYYYDVVAKREFLDTQPETLQYKRFAPTERMKLYAGQARIILDGYDQGLELLTPLTESKDAEIKKNAIIWTAFAYQQLGMQDKANEYLQIDPNIDTTKINELNQVWR